jgi:hypothetical protein
MQTYACGDCEDNDDDGLVDSDDPDCVGPCHNAEDTFYGSIPGQSPSSCEQDCYFDANVGAGNDRCVWSHACDPLSVAPDYPPQGPICAYDPDAVVNGLGGRQTCDELQAQSQGCLDSCLALVPNGCDCFGCCEIPGVPSGTVWLGSNDGNDGTCDRASVGDPSRCQPCTQVSSCANPCEKCELCVGKTELPADCPGAGDAASCSVPDCRDGQQACGSPCLPRCPAGQACITGCCVEPPR